MSNPAIRPDYSGLFSASDTRDTRWLSGRQLFGTGGQSHTYGRAGLIVRSNGDSPDWNPLRLSFGSRGVWFRPSRWPVRRPSASSEEVFLLERA